MSQGWLTHFINEAQTEGWVASLENLQVAIVARRISEGVWEPLYGIKRGEGRIGLPSCFSLVQEAQDALENMRGKCMACGENPAREGNLPCEECEARLNALDDEEPE